MLTKQDAKNIVDCVAKDPESKRRIDSNIDEFIPDSWGLSGALRNWGLVLTGADPTEKKNADIVCTGISNATSEAINKAIKAKDATLSKVASAGTIDRVLNGTHHTATIVKMKSKNAYVFDWHATLALKNPMIFPSAPDWKKDEKGVTFDDFNGFGVAAK